MLYALIYTEFDQYCEVDKKVPYQKVTLHESKELARKTLKKLLEDLSDDCGEWCYFDEYKKALEKDIFSKISVTDDEVFILDGSRNNPITQTWNIVEVSEN